MPERTGDNQCAGDNMCTNPRCPTHGIEWDEDLVRDDRAQETPGRLKTIE